MIRSPGDPHAVLVLVKHGIDLIVSAFSKSASDLGCILTWNLTPDVEGSERTDSGKYFPSVFADDLDKIMISLMNNKFKVDKSPPVHGCDCYTCKNHTRGYICHLLNVHEMLGDTLLQMYVFRL